MIPLQVDDLCVSYETHTVLAHISLQIPKGKLVAIVGPNGAGKTTLLKTTLGLIKPNKGRVAFFGLPLKKVRRKVAYIPQREAVDWDFPITVKDLVLMGRYGKRGFLSRPNAEDRMAVERYLSIVGLEALATRQISQLSGGQQQRAFLARALIQEADLYLMDEPFTGIDSASAHAIITILKQLRDQGKTLLAVHHDLPSVSEVFDWVLLLNHSVIGCGPVSQVFTKENIRKTYGSEQLGNEPSFLARGNY